MAKGYLLNINLNKVNPEFYNGWDGRLENTHLDTLSFQRRLNNNLNYNYEIWQINDETATISSTIQMVSDIAKKATPEDIVVITYSGHGAIDSSSSQMEEGLNTDQAWCLYDGLFKDNHIHKLLSLFKKGTRVVLFSFCCHSGSMWKTNFFSMALVDWKPKFMPYKLEKSIVPQSWIEARLQQIGCKQDLSCSLKYFGSCQVNQYSYDTDGGDAGCVAWWKAFDTNPKSPYVTIFRNIAKKGFSPDFQTPIYQNISKNKQFNNEYAFKI